MTIFVAIASYQDPELPHTIQDCLDNAARPDDVRFGVVDQTDDGGLDLGALSPKSRYMRVRSRHSQGLGWARAATFALYRDEDWLLQVDSHTMFDRAWDNTLVGWASRIGGHRTILTGYPMQYRIENDRRVKREDNGLWRILVTPGQAMGPNLLTEGQCIPGDAPVPATMLAGGFLFAPGRFVEEVPYDPHLYFRDEQAMMVRAWTRGWGAWHIPGIPLRHLYKPDDPTGRPVHLDFVGLTARADARLNRLFFGDGLPGSVYGLGTERTLAQFAEFSGLDYPRRIIEPRAFAPR